MGKAGDAEQAIPSPAPATGNGSILGRYGAVVGKALDAKCAFMLLLAVGVSLSAFSLLLHRRASGIIPDDPGTLVGDIQAGFILLKPRSTLASHARRLEEEIHSDMGVPNSKVSVSMHTFKLKYSTYVKFSIFPDPRDTSISEQSMSRLRKKLDRAYTSAAEPISDTVCFWRSVLLRDAEVPRRDHHDTSTL